MECNSSFKTALEHCCAYHPGHLFVERLLTSRVRVEVGRRQDEGAQDDAA